MTRRKVDTSSQHEYISSHLSPVSGMIAKIDVPAGESVASERAADKMPPPLVPVDTYLLTMSSTRPKRNLCKVQLDIPEKIPSLRASSLHVAMASLPPTWISLSYTFFSVASFTNLGIKSAAHP